MAAHNLITFKSHRDTLDGAALNELVSHYVPYRKHVSPSTDEQLPETDFRLFAVSVRFPRDLAASVPLTRIRDGVHEVRHFTGVIRVIVAHELPQEGQNAMIHLFSARDELIRYAAGNFMVKSEETSSLLEKLLEKYLGEESTMDALQELTRKTIREAIKKAPLAERLEGISADELLAALDPERREALKRRLREEETPPKSE